MSVQKCQWRLQSALYRRTHDLSAIDVTFGAYCEAFCNGEPRPDIPDTLYLLLADVKTEGRVGMGRGVPFAIKLWRFEAEFELVSAGGVVPP